MALARLLLAAEPDAAFMLSSPGSRLPVGNPTRLASKPHMQEDDGYAKVDYTNLGMPTDEERTWKEVGNDPVVKRIKAKAYAGGTMKHADRNKGAAPATSSWSAPAPATSWGAPPAPAPASSWGTPPAPASSWGTPPAPASSWGTPSAPAPSWGAAPSSSGAATTWSMPPAAPRVEEEIDYSKLGQPSDEERTWAEVGNDPMVKRIKAKAYAGGTMKHADRR